MFTYLLTCPGPTRGRVDYSLHIKIQAQLRTSKVDRVELLAQPRRIVVPDFYNIYNRSNGRIGYRGVRLRR